MSSLKYVLRTLISKKLEWDDQIPNDLQALWVSKNGIKELTNLKFRIIPGDVLNLDIETVDIGDAKQTLVCSAIYARFKVTLVPEGTTLPRSERLTTCLSATTGHGVKLSFGSYHNKCIPLTDSQVVLHWVNNMGGALKQWVRNIEINRLADKKLWRYVQSKNMIADLGTKKGAKVKYVRDDSTWINGYNWMERDFSKFPVKTVEEIKVDSKELKSSNDESLYKENVDLIKYDVETVSSLT